MKKLVMVLLALAIAVPAMAVDIDVVDNGDKTITVQYTAAVGENLRGVGIVLTLTDCTVAAGADSAINSEFNVRLDAAYDAEKAVSGSYGLGSGSALATVGEAGALVAADGDVSEVSISLGVLKSDQGAAADGTDIDLVTIALDNVGSAASVAVSADTLRGGLVGDAVAAGTLTGTTVAGGGCFGDFNADGYVDAIDVTMMIPAFGSSCTAGAYNPIVDLNGDCYVDAIDVQLLIPVFGTTCP